MNEHPRVTTYVDEIPSLLEIEVKEGERLDLNIALFSSLAKESVIKVNVHRNASFHGCLADFSLHSLKLDLSVNLLEEGAEGIWHSACLAKGDSSKVYETSVFHLARETKGLMSNYGIARDSSKITFAGISSIKNGAKKADTRQEAKIIVFDKSADGMASPALKIAENDVAASHAAVVGRLNEDHLFYLKSRGLDEESAKRLIATGYLKPIEQYFDDPRISDRLDREIERGF